MLRPSIFGPWLCGALSSLIAWSSTSGWILLPAHKPPSLPPQLRSCRASGGAKINRWSPWVVAPLASTPVERIQNDGGGKKTPLRNPAAPHETSSSGDTGAPQGVTASSTSPSLPPPLFASFLDHSPPPYLVVITDGDACDSDERLHDTLDTLQQAVETGQIDLVLVRLNYNTVVPSNDANEDTEADDLLQRQRVRRRARHLIRQLVTWSNASVGRVDEASGHRIFAVVWSSSLWRDGDDDDDGKVEVMEGAAHGVHFKEAHRPWISEFRASHQRNTTTGPDVRWRPVVGTSCHSVESALQALQQHAPDYLLVGTCYPTASHPEKAPDQVEGPDLPGRVRRAVLREWISSSQSAIPNNLHDNDTNNDFPHRPRPPYIVAIGGINATNCGEPIALGADGVAVIRAVSKADDPASAVRDLRRAIQRAWHSQDSVTRAS